MREEDSATLRLTGLEVVLMRVLVQRVRQKVYQDQMHLPGRNVRLLRFYGPTDFVSSFKSTLTDAMRSMDVSTSRVSGSRTHHVLPARLLVCLLSRFTCFFTLPIWIVDSSMLTILSYTYLLRLVDSSEESLFPDL